MILLLPYTMVSAEPHLLSGDSTSRLNAFPLSAPSLGNTADACTPERLGIPGPLPAPPRPAPPPTSPSKAPAPAPDGVDCTESGSKYGVLLDFTDGTALVHDGNNTITEVAACVMVSGATLSVGCTRGAGEYQLTFAGNSLERVTVMRNQENVATLNCAHWKRPASETTCQAFFTGYYIHPFTQTCIEASESGCSNPFAFTTRAACDRALRDPSRRVPLGK